jgi:flagellar protein FlaF
MSHDPTNNPYTQAAGTYNKQNKATPDQRELESHLLIKSAGELRRLYDRWDEATVEDIDNILTYNRKLWTVFFDSAIENPDERPKALRENIISLANFIFKRTIQILADHDKEKLLVLIDINREIAAGLNQSRENHPQTSSNETDSEGQEHREADNGDFTPTSI